MLGLKLNHISKRGPWELLTPGRRGCDFKHNFMIAILSTQVNITLKSMPEDPVDGMSTMVQVMSWCITRASVDKDFWHRMSSLYDNEF